VGVKPETLEAEEEGLTRPTAALPGATDRALPDHA
jgi:hypothetical protein